MGITAVSTVLVIKIITNLIIILVVYWENTIIKQDDDTNKFIKSKKNCRKIWGLLIIRTKSYQNKKHSLSSSVVSIRRAIQVNTNDSSIAIVLDMTLMNPLIVVNVGINLIYENQINYIIL